MRETHVSSYYQHCNLSSTLSYLLQLAVRFLRCVSYMLVYAAVHGGVDCGVVLFHSKKCIRTNYDNSPNRNIHSVSLTGGMSDQ